MRSKVRDADRCRARAGLQAPRPEPAFADRDEPQNSIAAASLAG
jgi:hypothetical protein